MSKTRVGEVKSLTDEGWGHPKDGLGPGWGLRGRGGEHPEMERHQNLWKHALDDVHPRIHPRCQSHFRSQVSNVNEGLFPPAPMP